MCGVCVQVLRERQTRLPCDERSGADALAARATFANFSFDRLKDLDAQRRQQGFIGMGVEQKHILRGRTNLFVDLLSQQDDETLALVTHKGFLRELERGPLGRPDAGEFKNCEVRVFDVKLFADGTVRAERLDTD